MPKIIKCMKMFYVIILLPSVDIYMHFPFLNVIKLNYACVHLRHSVIEDKWILFLDKSMQHNYIHTNIWIYKYYLNFPYNI